MVIRQDRRARVKGIHLWATLCSHCSVKMLRHQDLRFTDGERGSALSDLLTKLRLKQEAALKLNATRSALVKHRKGFNIICASIGRVGTVSEELNEQCLLRCGESRGHPLQAPGSSYPPEVTVRGRQHPLRGNQGASTVMLPLALQTGQPGP